MELLRRHLCDHLEAVNTATGKLLIQFAEEDDLNTGNVLAEVTNM